MPFKVTLIDGGLDLVSSPVATNPGRLQDCENFEVALNQGVKSIDGYERFDGGTPPSFYRVYKLTGDWATFSAGAGPPYWEAGSRFVLGGGPVSGPNQDGLVVGFDKDDINETIELWIAFDNSDVIYSPLFAPGNSISDLNSLSSFDILALVGYVTNFDATDTVEANQDNAAAAYAITRATIQEVPGQGSVLGLFWLKDELYACRDYFAVSFDGMANENLPEYNDELFIGASYATATWTGFLAKIIISGGTSLTDSQSGVMMFYNTSGTATATTIKNHSASDVSVATITEVGTTSQGAGLYKADGGRGNSVSTQSWTHQELGYRVRYKDGDAAFVPANRVSPTTDIADLIQSTDWVVPDNWQNTGGVWTGVGGGPFPDTTSIQTDDGDTSYFLCSFTANGAKPPFWVNTFGLTDVDIPDGSTITGFTVEVKRRAYNASLTTENIRDYVIQLKFPAASGVTNTAASFANRSANWPINAVDPSDASYATATYGGEQSLLGYGNVTPSAIKDDEFGFYMNTESLGYAAGSTQARITLVRVKVHFVPPQSKIYFWDGSTAVVAEVVMSYNTSGSIDNSPGDAKGHLFLMNVGTNRAVSADEEIRTMPPVGTAPSGNGDGSSLIAMTENAMTKNVMDWGALLSNQGKNPNTSKYQYVTSNFYAAADFDAIYGVSGAGPAFMYDGYAFTRIYTGTPEQDDIPRHCVVHQSRLFLGYRSGSVQYSVAGNPLSFDPLQFAGEIGVGAAVRGLMELNGDTLAEFTQKGVSMIQGDVGLSPYPGIISPDVGCVEYTAQQMGQFLYTSFRGIQNLRATQSYGDFDTSQFSWDVWSFLRPRVQTSAFFESSNIGVINSLPVRNKSQYRLMFADGKQLTATFLREGEMPQYTIQQYYHADGTTPLTWDVVTAGVESNGRDRLFGATDDDTGYVYEIDRGYSFDGGAISGYCVLEVDDQQTPYQDKNYTDCQVYGLATDYAAFTMSRAANYEDPDPGIAYQHEFGSLTNAPTGQESYATSASGVEIFGRNIAYRFDFSSNKQPPFTIQAIACNDLLAGEKRT
jgi:hypothetical protein